MLSAIAARKAAQAVLQASTVFPPDNVVPPEHPEGHKSIKKTVFKRKQLTQVSRPPKRKRKEKRVVAKPIAGGYRLEADSFRSQEDVVLVDSDESVLSEDSGTSSSGKRGWSPRMDSSDEDEEDSTATLNPTSNNSLHNTSTVDSLIMFTPSNNENIFNLGPADVSSLCLTSDSNNGASIIALRPEESICLLGTYSFTVLQGSVTLYGSTISSSPNSRHVFAPRSSPLPLLKGSGGTGAIAAIHLLPRPLHSLISQPVTLVLIQGLHTGIEGLGRICRIFDGVFKPPRGHDMVLPLQIDGVYMVPSQTKELQFLDVSESWKMGLSSPTGTSTTPGVFLVKGPKNTGKSTFARLLVNTLLDRYQRVAYLECDLGQSEFTPGGMVALNVISQPVFGPSFTHPKLPNYAHYIGVATPRSSPAHYLSSIQSLLEVYRLDIQTPATLWDDSSDDIRISDAIPLVMNTMGWNKGLGADLSLKIQNMAEPTDIYEIQHPPDTVRMDTFSPDANPPAFSQVRLHTLHPAPSSTLWTNYSAADHRSLSIISYFHAIFPTSSPSPDEYEQNTACAWRTSLPLCACPPYEVDGTRAFDNIVLTGAGAEDVVRSEIGRVLNGALVGVVTCQPATFDHVTDEGAGMSVDHERTLPYMQGGNLPPPATSTCRGLALVRSVSSTSNQMHILTPLPLRVLAESRVLVKGELELPIWGMLDYRDGEEGIAGIEKGEVPYLQWGKAGGVGGERRRVRRNLMRRGQM